MPNSELWRFGDTCHFEPQLITEANSVADTFEMAGDAFEGIRRCHERYAGQIAELAGSVA
ncbi:MAG: hypothetical protein ACI8UO_003971 [Verrucomicrobiales bacterium]|jgi:hypothetical protein